MEDIPFACLCLMQSPWHQRERERDLVLLVAGNDSHCPGSVMGQIYSGMAVSVFAASVSCPSSLLGRPFLTEQRQLGRCCFRLWLFRGG